MVGARHLKHLNINYNIYLAVPRRGIGGLAIGDSGVGAGDRLLVVGAAREFPIFIIIDLGQASS